MSRSGYTDDDCDNTLNLYRGTVQRAIRGKRGQAFLRELAAAMDSMPVKELIANELVAPNGQVCAIGAVCQARGLDVSKLDYNDPQAVAEKVGIAWQMAAEIEYENDEYHPDFYAHYENGSRRWIRMRRWVESNLVGNRE